ncbi:PHP domain-containing protein [Bacteroidales bacterium OttesenSCG-928-I21]|nr:PHP domain-containing protein [Bacteroidales bacterium OttesenSCG-928-I21]
MIKADLHIHSKFSDDGELGTKEIVENCIKQNLNVFSITDHNSTKGINETALFTKDKGIKLIPGIEIDCIYKGINLHVLGYNIDYSSKNFADLEKDVSSKMTASFDEMIANIRKIGFAVDAESVLKKAGNHLPTGELIAEVMLSNERFYSPLLKPYMTGGARSDMPYINFYLDYFAQGKPAFVPIEFMNYTDAVRLIKDNGGVPVVAHPGLNLKGKEHIAEELLDAGAEGLEVFNNYHDLEQIQYFAKAVLKRNALMTCGSDFHGKTKPLIRLGEFKFDNRYEDYLRNSLQTLKQREI